MQPTKLQHLAAWRSTPTNGSARARVILLHGLGEHSARHRNTIDFFLKKQIEVVRFDFRGAGQSEGRRQYVDKFTDYVDDVEIVLNWAKANGNLPQFLFGHSLGGAIAIYSAAAFQDKLVGLILTAPAYLPGSAVSPAKILAAKLLNRFIPKLAVPAALDVTAISRDEKVCQAYKADPLNCLANTIRQGNEIINALLLIEKKCSAIKIPTLLLHGDADRLVLFKGSERIFSALGTKDKKLHILSGGYHELHNDIIKDEFYGHLDRWLQGRI